MNLGETIYRLRTKQAMSQDTLAEALGVSRQSVSKWENNAAVPELEKLIKMSELFGVTLDELVGREAPTPPPPVETPVQRSSSRRTIGGVLLGFGLLATLLLSILGGFLFGIMVGMPFTVVGCILLSDSKEPLFHVMWGLFTVYAPLLYFFMLNFMGFGLYIKLLVIGLWLAALILWAVIRHRRGNLSQESRKLIICSLIIALVLTVLLCVGSSIYYRHTGLYSATATMPDVSFVESE